MSCDTMAPEGSLRLDKGYRTLRRFPKKIKTATTAAAKLVGGMIAEKAIKAGIKKVVFDRGGNLYHGRVKILADSAREKGLEF